MLVKEFVDEEAPSAAKLVAALSVGTIRARCSTVGTGDRASSNPAGFGCARIAEGVVGEGGGNVPRSGAN